MRDRRNLEWRLNWYRQSELDGALLLGGLVRLSRDPYLVQQLTRHCADEARHSWLWERTIVQLGLATVPIRRSYQSFYRDEIRPPRSITEALALTHVFERRVHRQFTEDLAEPGLADAVRRTLKTLIRDEEAHLDWIARWLDSRAGAAAMVARYREADDRIYRRLVGYRDRSWEIDDISETKCHTAEHQHPTQAFA
jgi:hypothetical protein